MSDDVTERFRNEVCTFMGTTTEALKNTSTRMDKLSDSVQTLKAAASDTSIPAALAEIVDKLTALSAQQEAPKKRWYEYFPIIIQAVAILAILWGMISFAGKVSALIDPAFLDRLSKIEKTIKKK